MPSRWIALAARLLADAADDEAPWSMYWRRIVWPDDWTADERTDLARAVESWHAGTAVGDHNAAPFLFMVQRFLAAELQRLAEPPAA